MTIPLSGHCCSIHRLRLLKGHKLFWGQTHRRVSFHGQSLMTLQLRVCKAALVFLGCSWNSLASLQPEILGFCALVPTLVKGWAAPLIDLSYSSLTLSSQPGITPKPTWTFKSCFALPPLTISSLRESPSSSLTTSK